MPVESDFLPAAIKRFKFYKELGDKTFSQLTEEAFFFTPSTESNSIAVIIQHMYGNAISRWTNFLTEDGEKDWRRRDAEFILARRTKEELLSLWDERWQILLSTLESLNSADLQKTIYIRTEPLIVFDAILRQLAHYPYHVGQIVYLGKVIKDKDWKSLSIPRGQSDAYNQSLNK